MHKKEDVFFASFVCIILCAASWMIFHAVFCSSMEYLLEKPVISLAQPRSMTTKHHFFFAEMFDSRPEVQAMSQFKNWAVQIQGSLIANLSRSACPVQWLGLFIDQAGACLIGTPKCIMSVGNFRQACYKILEKLPGDQQEMITKTMRPLDEVDYRRISQWTAIEQFRPTRERGPQLLAIEDGSPPPRQWRTKAEWLAENEEVPCMDLAIPSPGNGQGWL